MKVASTGTFCIGVSRKVPAAELDGPIGNNKNSWGLHSSVGQFSDGDVVGEGTMPCKDLVRCQAVLTRKKLGFPRMRIRAERAADALFLPQWKTVIRACHPGASMHSRVSTRPGA